MTELKQIQQQLTQAIDQSNMSHAEIARKLNISQQTLSQYISGNVIPPLDFIANLCKQLGLDANKILCVDNNRKN